MEIEAGDQAKAREELGDLLFVCANLARRSSRSTLKTPCAPPTPSSFAVSSSSSAPWRKADVDRRTQICRRWRTCGTRPRRRSGTRPDPLSPRERGYSAAAFAGGLRETGVPNWPKAWSSRRTEGANPRRAVPRGCRRGRGDRARPPARPSPARRHHLDPVDRGPPGPLQRSEATRVAPLPCHGWKPPPPEVRRHPWRARRRHAIMALILRRQPIELVPHFDQTGVGVDHDHLVEHGADVLRLGGAVGG